MTLITISATVLFVMEIVLEFNNETNILINKGLVDLVLTLC